jgi:hypothetical protein
MVQPDPAVAPAMLPAAQSESTRNPCPPVMLAVYEAVIDVPLICASAPVTPMGAPGSWPVKTNTCISEV